MRSRSTAAFLVAVLMTIAIPLSAQKQSKQPPPLGSDIATKTLTNGMKVIVWSDHDIPNVALYNWVRAGSRNEYPGITGLSHFFEHMMFNGAKKYGPGEFDRVMEANGGSNNAFTSQNVTVYQDWFPRTALELIFDLEADRMKDLSFDPAIIESERGVVYSERRSAIDNDNGGMLNEQVQATAYLAHPYQFPVIGWPSDIESWSHEDLERYYRTYYAPNNATLIVVGDVKPAEIFALAEKYLEPIPAQAPPPPVKTKEPEQRGERRVTIRKEAQVPLLQEAYHVGNASDPDGPALDLLLTILSDGDSSRLHQRLVENERKALSVGAYRSRGFDPSLVWFYVTLTSESSLAETEASLHDEMAAIARDGVTAAELQKAKNIYLADFWRGMQTINGKAYQLGNYEVFHGDYRKLFSAPDVYAAVTADQVRTVAAKYLKADNRTVGWLVPTAAAGEKEASR
jgi:zinc protease